MKGLEAYALALAPCAGCPRSWGCRPAVVRANSLGAVADVDLDLRSHFDELIGTEWVNDDPDGARVRIEVRDELKQPAGLLHGGVYSTLVESICSRATALAVLDAGMQAMGQSLEISFLRPVTAGTLTVDARARHRGRTTWVWDAEASDSEGQLCALARITVAIRPLERG
jgi:1,4-dihydroxy-2-naphthoyl-CoA hydrolase